MFSCRWCIFGCKARQGVSFDGVLRIQGGRPYLTPRFHAFYSHSCVKTHPKRALQLNRCINIINLLQSIIPCYCPKVHPEAILELYIVEVTIHCPRKAPHERDRVNPQPMRKAGPIEKSEGLATVRSMNRGQARSMALVTAHPTTNENPIKTRQDCPMLNKRLYSMVMRLNSSTTSTSV